MMETVELAVDLSHLSGLMSLGELLKGEEIESLAYSSGFICRSSSILTGEAFLRLQSGFILGSKEWSLSDQCDYLEDEFGISLVKQSLDRRYHTYAVSFMKNCYDILFSKIFSGHSSPIGHTFSGILLSDSTSIRLPSSLSPFYPSMYNNKEDSSVKINQTIDIQSFRIMDIQIWEGKASDNNYEPSGHVNWGKNNLWLKDLGYYSFDTFVKIATDGDFFLSRYKTNTNLYVKNAKGKYEVLGIEEYLASLSTGVHSKAIYIGKTKKKIEGRLICEAVPESVKAQRLKKYEYTHTKQNFGKATSVWEMTALKTHLCGYNLFITNATEEQLPNDSILLVYALRWQIELFFKIWKSLLFMDQVGQMNIFRFECFLYGRLIFLLLSTEIMAFIKETIADIDLDIEISEWKTMKILKKKCP